MPSVPVGGVRGARGAQGAERGPCAPVGCDAVEPAPHGGPCAGAPGPGSPPRAGSARALRRPGAARWAAHGRQSSGRPGDLARSTLSGGPGPEHAAPGAGPGAPRGAGAGRVGAVGGRGPGPCVRGPSGTPRVVPPCAAPPQRPPAPGTPSGRLRGRGRRTGAERNRGAGSSGRTGRPGHLGHLGRARRLPVRPRAPHPVMRCRRPARRPVPRPRPAPVRPGRR